MRNLVRASVLLLALVLSEPVLAGQLEDAEAAYGKEDYATALRLLRPLAAQGDAGAQDYLGFMYRNGYGVPQDYAQAAKWFRLAADQANAWAQGMLGIMYQAGDGVPQDYVEAHKWFNLSAAWAPDADTRKRAAEIRDILAKRMTPAQVAEAQRMSREWQPK